jgi:hypothetical protein
MQGVKIVDFAKNSNINDRTLSKKDKAGV